MTFDIPAPVWRKGVVVANVDENRYRKDVCGAWIEFGKYGDRNSGFGWEVDHIIPESKNGSDDISNLRPLQWENNARRQAGELTCSVTADGKFNVRS